MRKMFFTVLNSTPSEFIDETYKKYAIAFFQKDNWFFLKNEKTNEIVNLSCAVIVPNTNTFQSFELFFPQFITSALQAAQKISILSNLSKPINLTRINDLSQKLISQTKKFLTKSQAHQTIFDLIATWLWEIILHVKSANSAAHIALISTVALCKAFGYEFTLSPLEIENIEFFTKEYLRMIQKVKSENPETNAEWQNIIAHWLTQHCVIATDDFSAQTINNRRELRPFMEPCSVMVRSVELWKPENLFVSWDLQKLIPNSKVRDNIATIATQIETML